MACWLPVEYDSLLRLFSSDWRSMALVMDECVTDDVERPTGCVLTVGMCGCGCIEREGGKDKRVGK